MVQSVEKKIQRKCTRDWRFTSTSLTGTGTVQGIRTGIGRAQPPDTMRLGSEFRWKLLVDRLAHTGR
jgi:hypothetical protein